MVGLVFFRIHIKEIYTCISCMCVGTLIPSRECLDVSAELGETFCSPLSTCLSELMNIHYLFEVRLIYGIFSESLHNSIEHG